MNYGTVQTGAYIGLFCWAMLSVLVYCLAPVSGAHMNCMVTFTTIICGLCPLPRGVIYMFFQLVGASVAGGVLLASWGIERALELVTWGRQYHPRCALKSNSPYVDIKGRAAFTTPLS